MEYGFAYPNDDLPEKYSKKVAPIIEKVLAIQRENNLLESMRDYLLPMLMNGQIKVTKEDV